MIHIASVVQNDVQQRDLLKFLGENELPFSDIILNGNLFKLYYDRDGVLIGSGGLEFYRDYALLRSIAVNRSERGKSIGRSIVKDLTQQAKSHGVGKIFLLTETAPRFFEKMGFEKIKRDAVPEPVKQSSEFSGVCPVSAVCMEYIVV